MSEWSPGMQLGPYELTSPIGKGGMGEVWQARDTRLNRVVAIKRLKTDFADRFKREARAIAALNHPHICQLYDVGDDYLVMEYVNGTPLKGKLSPEETLRLAIQITSALEDAHAAGIIHRDLKPANILVSAKGAKVLDFGLAKMSTTPSFLDDSGFSEISVSLTAPGMIVGTVAYMSPEQAQGLPVDGRSDVFALGVVLYEALNGRHAFQGDTALATLTGILHTEPPPVEGPDSLASPCLRFFATKTREKPRKPL